MTTPPNTGDAGSDELKQAFDMLERKLFRYGKFPAVKHGANVTDIKKIMRWLHKQQQKAIAAHDRILIKTILAEDVPEKRVLREPVTQRIVTDGDKVGIDLDADTRGSLKFVQDNGFNQGIDQITSALQKRLEGMK